MKLQIDTCPICLEPLAAITSKVQPCSHSFCRACICTWATLRATCPLCLEPFVTISIASEEEDTKEEVIKVSGTGTAYMQQQEEEFDCLDHGHFVKEFQAIYKRAKEVEFELKARVVIKRGGASERDYQLILHMKHEIELKLAFLAQEKKIFPKELLKEVEHFSNVIKSFCYGSDRPKGLEDGYLHDVYADEEYYGEGEGRSEGYCLFDFAIKKSPNMKKGNRKGKMTKGKTEGQF